MSCKLMIRVAIFMVRGGGPECLMTRLSSDDHVFTDDLPQSRTVLGSGPRSQRSFMHPSIGDGCQIPSGCRMSIFCTRGRAFPCERRFCMFETMHAGRRCQRPGRCGATPSRTGWERQAFDLPLCFVRDRVNLTHAVRCDRVTG